MTLGCFYCSSEFVVEFRLGKAQNYLAVCKEHSREQGYDNDKEVD